MLDVRRSATSPAVAVTARSMEAGSARQRGVALGLERLHRGLNLCQRLAVLVVAAHDAHPSPAGAGVQLGPAVGIAWARTLPVAAPVTVALLIMLLLLPPGQ